MSSPAAKAEEMNITIEDAHGAKAVVRLKTASKRLARQRGAVVEYKEVFERYNFLKNANGRR